MFQIRSDVDVVCQNLGVVNRYWSFILVARIESLLTDHPMARKSYLRVAIS